MNDTYRQQHQSQHLPGTHSRMNHVPRALSTGRIRSNTTTPTAAATVMSAISPMMPQPAPGTAMKTVETESSKHPVGGGESSGCKPASNDSNPAILSSNFNGSFEGHQDGKNISHNHTSANRGARSRSYNTP